MIARQFEAPGSTDHLGHMRIHVQTLESVMARRQGIEEHRLVEPIPDVQPIRIAGDRGEVIEHLVHAAIFGCQDILHVIRRARRSPFIRPCGHAGHDRERLRVAREPMHVEQAGHNLVVGVKWRPYVGSRVQTVEPGEGKCTEITSAIQLRLALG